MNKHRCLTIADRISALLVREIKHGIDPSRMIRDSRYARDVLLVCEAHPGSDLASLARHFRAAAAAADAPAETETITSGASRFFSSMFSGLGDTPTDRPQASRRTGWFTGRRGPADK